MLGTTICKDLHYDPYYLKTKNKYFPELLKTLTGQECLVQRFFHTVFGIEGMLSEAWQDEGSRQHTTRDQ